LKPRRVKKLNPKIPLVENAARIIRVRLAEMRSFAPEALEPERSGEQHDMRIAAKRLRYILEVTGFCYGKPAQTAARCARELQDLLGEVHDCDVMLPRIDAHVAELRTRDALAVRRRAGDAKTLDPALVTQARHRSSYRGLEVLAVYVEARRQLFFDRFVALWREQEREGTWDRLERVVTRRLHEARERRRRTERLEKAQRQLEDAKRDERDASERAREAAADLAAAAPHRLGRSA
jgi:CHAD domain-containing protein